MKRKYKAQKSKGFLATKQQKLTAIIGLFIISIMVLSVLNSYGDNEEENYTYQGLKFYNTEAGWIANTNTQTITIISNPKDLENISINYIPLNIMNSMEKIYLSINPEDQNREALFEFNRGLKLTPRIVTACYEDNDQCIDSPLKTCEDSTENVGVIVMKESNVTEVSLKYNCLTIQGENLLQLVDKLILQQI
jgi:hypothetical protein